MTIASRSEPRRATAEPAPARWRFGAVELNEGTLELRVNGARVKIERKPLDLLRRLVRTPGVLITKEQLLEAVWPGRIVTESVLAKCVARVREVIGDAGQTVIRTQHGFGYCLDVAVERADGTAAAAATKSLAILPFKPLAAGDRDESLELGIADALIASLGQVPQLVVRPLGTVRPYTDPGTDPCRAGRELRADAVLDGSIQRVAGRVRITARLLDVGAGTTLWSGRFDEANADIFAVQDSIAQKLAGALAPRFGGPAPRARRPSVKAYELYQKGRYHWAKANEEGLRRAIELFNQAIAVDPDYALAYAAISDSYTALDWYGVLSTRESNPQAKAAADRALALDDSLGDAHSALAMALQYRWEWDAAERSHRRALELNPNFAEGHQRYGCFLSFMGRPDGALAHLRRAQELNPVSLAIGSQAGLVLQNARRYEEAVVEHRKVLELEPDNAEALFFLGMTRTLQGRYDDAIEAYRRLDPGNPDFQAMLGHAYAASGRRREAEAIARELEARGRSHFTPYFWVALMHLGFGDKAAALDCLERAYADPDDSLVNVKATPFVDPLRGEPRFEALLRRMNLG